MKKRKYLIDVLSIYGQTLSQVEQEILQKAHCIVGAKALLEALPLLCESLLNLSNNGLQNKILCEITSPIDKVYKFINKHHQDGKRVVVLAEGDALYFGMGSSLLKHFEAKDLNIHAGISISQRLCALVGLTWKDVEHISLHGRHEQGHWHKLCVAVFTEKPVCILTDKYSTPQNIANFLIKRGASELNMYVAENWGHVNETLYKLSLTKAASFERVIEGSYTILLVPNHKQKRTVLGLTAHEVLHEKNLMTKQAVRATALSFLRIEKDYNLWDIGSGSGALALEMCKLAPSGQIVAVEKNPKRVKHIMKNRKRFGAVIMDICQGEAPYCFPQLAKLSVRPQGIFVGGGLNAVNAHELLAYLFAALLDGGRMVISCVLLGTLQKSMQFFHEQGIEAQIVQLGVNVSAPLAKDLRFVPENPVFLLVVEKNTHVD